MSHYKKANFDRQEACPFPGPLPTVRPRVCFLPVLAAWTRKIVRAEGFSERSKLTLVLATIQEKFVTSVQFSPTSQRFGSGASTLLTKPLTGQQLWEYGTLFLRVRYPSTSSERSRSRFSLDPATYLLKFYNQFCNIIMIVCFLPGRIVVIKLMNFLPGDLYRGCSSLSSVLHERPSLERLHSSRTFPTRSSRHTPHSIHILLTRLNAGPRCSRVGHRCGSNSCG